MLFSRPALAAACFFLVSIGGAACARPISPAEDRTIGYDGDLPSCDDYGILGAIKSQFDAKQFWFGENDLSIVAFEQAGELGYRKHGADFIPRRYCEVKALFNDGRPREVKYNIIERGGFVGFGPGVEFCAVGEDRALAFPPHCSGAVR
ncbi:hypothetical protein CCR94_16625 [Rhodoblastus sphagnicola]|uniref:Uncharacterized protein n=1 Tax=Rhodoblastus sphagnicola TaxID=333368 RepID=A0A2S6N310_9HYPH|nr:hypothetical protein [Rhodoblastus sphagnicola]MBB4199122.1 hypothetical protein [Rhodoblastus sphagnicola]PPQ29011.1 hypothetical protein CCR94_16625 [Rhodoblastus sphagnicola]